MTGFFIIAWRNFIRNIKRYRILLLALILITAVLSMVLSLVLGMRESLYEKASRYFAGNLVVFGYKGDGRSLIEDSDAVMEAIRDLESFKIPIKAYARRSTYYDIDNIELFFSGYYLKQRRLVGVEWALERPILNDMFLIDGSIPENEDETAILISSAAAERLHIGVGDNIIISIRSDRQRINTGSFIVQAIFSESSFFGYQAYIHRKALNRLREAPEDRVNEIGIYIKNPAKYEQFAAKLLGENLGRNLQYFGVMQNRDEYLHQAYKKRETREYGIITIGAQLQEIDDLLEAMTIISGTAIFLFLVIVVVGVGNTFTMIIWERTREIGTFRALGMNRFTVTVSFLIESALLGFWGSLFGLAAGIGILECVRFAVVFPSNMVSSLFLTQNKINWQLSFWGVAAISGLVMLACVLGSLRASIKAGRLSPVEAMSHKKK